VVAADVYAVAPHVGRGGWSWYTGSAGWMYRLIVESLLGVERHAEKLRLSPQLPSGWAGFRLHYRHRSATYTIDVMASQQDGLFVDGTPRDGNVIDLVDDGREHAVELRVARQGAAMSAAREDTTAPHIR
jgi:cyclic beta-1,2-glucan synthetase